MDKQTQAVVEVGLQLITLVMAESLLLVVLVVLGLLLFGIPHILPFPHP